MIRNLLKNFWLKNKVQITHEMGMWITIASSFFIADGKDVLLSLYSGDFSRATLGGIYLLCVTSLVKSLLVMVAPSLFPLYRKDQGILPPLDEN